MITEINNKQRPRIDWIDIYRGLAIIAVVIGHSGSPLTPFVYLFHIPAFYFISGYVSSFEKYTFGDFLVRRFKRLLIPYFVFNLSFLFLHVILRYLGYAQFFFLEGPFELGQNLNGLIFFNYTEPIGGASWFLIVLFETELIAHVLIKVVTRIGLKRYFILVFGAVYLAVGFLAFERKIYVGYQLDLTSAALFFVLLGYFARQNNLAERIKYRGFLALPSLGLLWYYVVYQRAAIDFPSRVFGVWYNLIVTSLSGVILLFSVSTQLPKSRILTKILAYIGENTLAILFLHFLSFKILHLFLYEMKKVDLTQVQQLTPQMNNSYWVIAVLFGVTVPLGIQWLIDKTAALCRVGIGKYSKTIIQMVNSPATIEISVLVLATALLQGWAINANNFFYADDFGWFLFVSEKAIGDFLYLIPIQMYNDRPVGQLVIKLLYEVFKNNNVLHHLALLSLHIGNSILVYTFARRMLSGFLRGPTYFIPFLSALVFANWPKSVFAVQWDGAIFDLLSCFLVLIFLNLFMITEKRFNFAGIVALVLSYLLMVRVKEAVIFLPLVLFSMVIFRDFPRIFSSSYIAENKRTCFVLLSLLALMIGYASYLLYLAFSTAFMGFSEDTLYHPVFNVIVVLENAFRYLYMYLSTFEMGQVFSGYGSAGLLLTSSFLLAAGFIFARKPEVRRTILFLATGALITLIPVLPLANMQHKLYLYTPAIFLSLFSVLVASNLLRRIFRKEVLLTSALLFLGYLNLFFPPVRNERTFWLAIGEENRAAFNNLLPYQPPQSGTTVKIYNLGSPTNIFTFGNGAVLRLIWHRDDLGIQLSTDCTTQAVGSVENEGTYLIDYRDLIRKKTNNPGG